MADNDKKDDDVPLVSGRSPSYERARHERAHPSPTTDPAVIAAVAHLFELEEHARQSFVAGAGAARDPDLVARLEASADVHARRRDALGGRIMALGGAPPRLEDCRPLLAHGPRSIAHATGDRAVVDELKGLQAELHEEYAKARGTLEDAASGLDLETVAAVG